jgi:hypothetical protein
MTDDDFSDSEFWRAYGRQRQEKRASNREQSAKMLTDAGIAFEAKNYGAHLVVDGIIDFWPGTGLWMPRGTARRRYGVRNLISHVRSTNKPEAKT